MLSADGNKLEDVRRPLAFGLANEIVCEILEDAAVACLVHSCKERLGDILPEAEMIALTTMCFYGNNQVSQTLAIAQLAEHHGKELVPAYEVFHISVTSILDNKVIEVIPAKEHCQLGEHVF